MSPHLEHVVLRLPSGTVSPRQCSELTLTLPFLEKASTRVISDQFIAISVVDAFSDLFTWIGCSNGHSGPSSQSSALLGFP